MLNSPVSRPLTRALATALTDARPSGGAAPVPITFDPATKSAVVTLSNGNLTTSTTDYDLYAIAKSTASHSTGKRVISMVAAFPSSRDNTEANIGVCTAGYDTTDGSGGTDETQHWFTTWDGYASHAGVSKDITATANLSGEPRRVFIDFDAGKMWFGGHNTVDGDPEAGTGATHTFTPNTPLFFVAVSYSFDDATPVTVTVDPTYTSGTFAAWDPASPSTDESAAAFDPATEFATADGLWLRAWTNVDLSVNHDGTGGSPAAGGTVGRWGDHNSTNHFAQATAALRPVFVGDGVAFPSYWDAGDAEYKGGWMSNAALTDTFDRADMCFGMVVTFQGAWFAQTPFALGGAADNQFMLRTGAMSEPLHSHHLVPFDGTSMYPLAVPFSGRKCVITGRSNGSGVIVNVTGPDGVRRNYTMPPMDPYSLTKAALGAYTNGATNLGHLILHELLLFDADLGESKVAGMRNYLHTQAGTASIDFTKTVVMVGDSRFGGWGPRSGEGPMRFMTQRATSHWYNFARAGADLSYPSIHAWKLEAYKGSAEGILLVLTGLNAIDTIGDEGPAHDRLAAYCAEARAWGYTVLVGNESICEGEGGPDFHTALANYNTLIAANWTDYADGLVDLAAAIGSYLTNPENYSDAYHFSDAGNALVAAAFDAAMAGLS